MIWFWAVRAVPFLSFAVSAAVVGGGLIGCSTAPRPSAAEAGLLAPPSVAVLVVSTEIADLDADELDRALAAALGGVGVASGPGIRPGPRMGRAPAAAVPVVYTLTLPDDRPGRLCLSLGSGGADGAGVIEAQAWVGRLGDAGAEGVVLERARTGLIEAARAAGRSER
jgi:hypothetical protein